VPVDWVVGAPGAVVGLGCFLKWWVSPESHPMFLIGFFFHYKLITSIQWGKTHHFIGNLHQNIFQLLFNIYSGGFKYCLFKKKRMPCSIGGETTKLL